MRYLANDSVYKQSIVNKVIPDVNIHKEIEMLHLVSLLEYDF